MSWQGNRDKALKKGPHVQPLVLEAEVAAGLQPEGASGTFSRGRGASSVAEQAPRPPHPVVCVPSAPAPAPQLPGPSGGEASAAPAGALAQFPEAGAPRAAPRGPAQPTPRAAAPVGRPSHACETSRCLVSFFCRDPRAAAHGTWAGCSPRTGAPGPRAWCPCFGGRCCCPRAASEPVTHCCLPRGAGSTETPGRSRPPMDSPLAGFHATVYEPEQGNSKCSVFQSHIWAKTLASDISAGVSGWRSAPEALRSPRGDPELGPQLEGGPQQGRREATRMGPTDRHRTTDPVPCSQARPQPCLAHSCPGASDGSPGRTVPPSAARGRRGSLLLLVHQALAWRETW